MLRFSAVITSIIHVFLLLTKKIVQYSQYILTIIKTAKITRHTYWHLWTVREI